MNKLTELFSKKTFCLEFFLWPALIRQKLVPWHYYTSFPGLLAKFGWRLLMNFKIVYSLLTAQLLFTSQENVFQSRLKIQRRLHFQHGHWNFLANVDSEIPTRKKKNPLQSRLEKWF